ncbi:hypothetical protein HK104_011197 [Borealophlyctis nickersoniae]|nr:hypothetical protein HK104_011197 [Borealophlyctis nickersoniae]
MRLTAVVACVLLAWATVAAAYDYDTDPAYLEAYKKIHHFDPSTFNATASEGQWLIFFGSTKCPHCVQYVPIWLQGQEYAEKAALADTGFRIGKVECYGPRINEDLCTDVGIEGYPTVRLYRDGAIIDEPEDVRELDKLTAYIDAKAKEWAQLNAGSAGKEAKAEPENEAALESDEKIEKEDVVQERQGATSATLDSAIAELVAHAEAQTKPNPQINPQGRVFPLTSETFWIMTNNTPWFVMFYAPWCSHCHRLAPVWEDLAPALKHYVNIGKVDCTVEKSVCSKFGVRGYPTLRYLQQPGPSVDYKGSRTFHSLKEYAMGLSSKTPFEVLAAPDVKSIMKEREVSFFFYFDPRTMNKAALSGFTSVAMAVRNQAQLFVTPDPEARKLLGLTEAAPQLVVSRDYGADIMPYAGSHENSFAAKQYMRQFIIDRRLPLMPQLDTNNQDEILGSDRLVVMLIIDPSNRKMDPIMNNLRKTARLWAKKEAEEKMHDLVHFTWLDGTKWKLYTQRVYGLGEADFPAVIIADPAKEQYYDTDKSGRRLSFDPNALVENINAILDGEGKPKSSTGMFRTMILKISRKVSPVAKFVANNVLLSLVILVGALGFCFCYPSSASPAAHHRLDPKAE